MTSATEAERFKDLYDVERHVMATDGGIPVEDPYTAARTEFPPTSTEATTEETP